LMFLGFAGEAFKKEAQVVMQPGEQITVGHFTVRHDALRVTQDAQKQMITGHVSVFDGDKAIGEMRPAKHFFNRRENEPTTEVAIRRGVGEDLYIVLAGYEAAEQSATYTITVNPLVNWIWFGFAIMTLGTILTLLPETAFALAAAKMPAGAATTSMLVFALFMPAPVQAHSPATGEAGQTLATPVERSPLWKKLEGEIMCTCGCNSPMNDCPMEPNCHGLETQRAKLAKFLEAGMNEDEVLRAFVADYGHQAVLARPIDEGFNRLAWLFPYLLGIGTAIGVGIVATRWSRRGPVQADTANDVMTPEDSALQTRLDDELRDLD
jgi:cytochrome c-type biogenesis protein CcmH/NrfF